MKRETTTKVDQMVTIVHGEQNTGKNLNKEALTKLYNCTTCIDDWKGWGTVIPNILYLTNTKPPYPINIRVPNDCVRIVHIPEALKNLG